jgi:hypothetical protein
MAKKGLMELKSQLLCQLSYAPFSGWRLRRGRCSVIQLYAVLFLLHKSWPYIPLALHDFPNPVTAGGHILLDPIEPWTQKSVLSSISQLAQ